MERKSLRVNDFTYKEKEKSAERDNVESYEPVDSSSVPTEQTADLRKDRKKKVMKMKTVIDRYGIIAEGNILNGYKAAHIKDHPQHLYQKGNLFYDRRKLMFISGTKEEILKFWTESERKWTRNICDCINGRQGLVVTVPDDPTAMYKFSELREFQNSLEELVASTNAIVTTNGQSSLITETCARMVARLNQKRKADDHIALFGVISWKKIKWQCDDTKQRETLDEDHTRLFIVQKDKEQQEHALEFVERIFGIEPHTKAEKTVLPRIMIVFGGRMETLKKIAVATIFKTQILLVKNSGGVADLLSDIIERHKNKDQDQAEKRSHKYSIYENHVKAIFEVSQFQEVKNLLQVLQERGFHKYCCVCNVKDLPLYGVKLAFNCAKTSKLTTSETVSCDRMCVNIIENGKKLLATLLKENTGKKVLGRLTWKGLAYLYTKMPNSSLNTDDMAFGGKDVNNYRHIRDTEIGSIFRRVNGELQNQLKIKSKIYHLPDNLDGVPSHRDVFVWYLLSEQIDIAETLWMKSSEMTIRDAFLASFILDGLQTVVYGKKEVRKLQMKSKDFIINATNMLNECCSATKGHGQTEIASKQKPKKEFSNKAEQYTEIMLRQQLSVYGFLQLACSHGKSTFVKHASVRHLLQKKWYGDNTGLKGFVVPVLILLFLPLLIFVLPVLILFRKHQVQKFIEEWNTSSVKYLLCSVWHVVFILLFMFTLLVDLKPNLTANDVLLALWVGSLVIEDIRQLYVTDGESWKEKIGNFMNLRNIVDVIAALGFYIGLLVKFLPFNLYEPSRVILALVFILYTLRSLELFSISRTLGPKVIMIRKMFIQDLTPFLVIMVVFLIAFSICDYAILYHNSEFSWNLLENIFKQGYWMVYGTNGLETFDLTEPICTYNKYVYSANLLPRCPDSIGKSAVPYIRGIFILIMFVMIINIIIAMFAKTYAAVQEESYMHWVNTFNATIKEHESKPFLPPPALVFFPVHVMLFVIIWIVIVPFYNCHQCCSTQKGNESDTSNEITNAMDVKRNISTMKKRITGQNREVQGNRCSCYYKKLYNGFDLFVTLYISSEVSLSQKQDIKYINRFEKAVKRIYKQRFTK